MIGRQESERHCKVKGDVIPTISNVHLVQRDDGARFVGVTFVFNLDLKPSFTVANLASAAVSKAEPLGKAALELCNASLRLAPQAIWSQED